MTSAGMAAVPDRKQCHYQVRLNSISTYFIYVYRKRYIVGMKRLQNILLVELR